MAHQIITIGSKLPALVDLDGPQTSWPDKDLDVDAAGNRLEATGRLVAQPSPRFGRVRAVALAYDSDWDFVRIRPQGGGDAHVLGPGRVLDLSDYGAQFFTVEPHIAPPSTRLLMARILQKYNAQAPTEAPRWTIDSATKHPRNDTGATQTAYQWNATLGWRNPTPIAAGAEIGLCVVDDNATVVEYVRPSDWSPDGLWSFADYMEAGLIVDDTGASQKNVSYISLASYDSRGNPGSNGLATTVKYAVGSNQWADISTLFYGRLRLELWTDNDCPPHGYRPRLAPVRFVRLGARQLAGGAAAPNTALITVPALNVARAQYTFKNVSAGQLLAQFVQPRAEDWIDQVAGVADVDPTTGLSYSAIDGNTDGALYIEEPIAGYLKIAAGAVDAGGATIPAGSLLALVRRE